LVLFAARLILSLARSGPVLVADEAGYLTNARVLAGGLPQPLENAPFYRGGYSLAIWPFAELSSDPGLVYHLILVLNAALAASLVPLLYILLTRYADVQPVTAAWAAIAGAAYPAVTVLSQAAMSENVLFPLTCLWLIAFGGLLNSRGTSAGLLWAAALGAAASALWMVHGRMVAAVAVTALIVAVLGLRRRLHAGAAVTVLLVLAGGIAGTHLLDAYLIDQSWGGEATSEATNRLSELDSVDSLLSATANLMGQWWYLVAGTFGLAAIALALAVSGLRRSAAASPQVPAVLLILAGLTVALLLVSAGSFPGHERPDMLVYGRYTEVAAPALVAFGLAILVSDRSPLRMPSALFGFAAFSLAVVLLALVIPDSGNANRWDVSALPFGTFDLGPGVLTAAALVAGGGAWVLLRSSARYGLGAAVLALALFMAVIAYGAWNPVLRSERSVYPGSWTSPEPVADAHRIRSLSYDVAHEDLIGRYVYPWFLPRTMVKPFAGGSPPLRFFISSRSWAREHPHNRAVALWSASGADQVLWRLSGQPAMSSGAAG
jgi:hypothetical protein